MTGGGDAALVPWRRSLSRVNTCEVVLSPLTLRCAKERSRDVRSVLRNQVGSGADLDGIFMISTSVRHDRDPIVEIPQWGIWDPVLKVAIPVESTVAVGARREVSQ